MNVAVLELCEELYELSGWEDTLLRHPLEKAMMFDTSLITRTAYGKWVGVEDNTVGCDECEGEYRLASIPAYDLGYLLRKLPKGAVVSHVDERWNATGPYSAWLDENEYYDANTPEDAACKLAIELFKLGVLKREVA